jgi:hypothetical protein
VYRNRGAFPWLGPRQIDQISAPELLKVRRRVEGREATREAEAVSPWPPLAEIADAIASASRSPLLNDLAIARAAPAYIKIDHAVRDAPNF